MSKPLPRLALVLPATAEGAKVAADVLEELRAAPTVNVIAVGKQNQLRGASPLDPARALDGLARIRAAQGTPLIEPAAGESGADAASRLLGEGHIDGVVLFGPRSDEARLRIRDGVRVIEPYPASRIADVGAKLSNDLVETLVAAKAVLVALGVASPRIALFDLDEAPVLREVARAARSLDVQAIDPSAPGRAVSQRADALLALTQTQVELPLALQGTGPETCLSLSGPWAWPGELGPRSTVLAIDRLARRVAASGAPLAEERELARKPSVSISKRERAPSAAKDRCPYCHRRLDESPDGSAGRPGPAVTCADCGTPHHRGCVTEHGQCTVLGCRSTRMLRLGITIPVSRLGGDAAAEHAFQTLAGAADAGPRYLRVEAPIDDPDAHPTRRRLGIELASRTVRRGEVLEGYIVVWAPRPFRVRGGAIRLRASLTTRRLSGNRTPHTEPIFGRQASFVGAAPAGALGRLQDGVVGLFSKTGVAIPTGVRRYPFSFQVDGEHPATVHNRQGDVEESVTTLLEASLDTDSAEIALEVC